MASNKQCFDKILISACFLGERVRYNGEVKALASQLLSQWQSQGRLISVCPEVISGLPVPRPPAEINPKTLQVITIDSVDVSQQFSQGAQQALRLCQQHNIRFALLKESSPSCGSNTIYDGSFSQQKIVGEGITTKLLRQHGIQVFSEFYLKQLQGLLDQ
ncbi:hypothetical protein CMT41_01430 [Colwellia sp. MT41]|uniref:DUF523 domain-containing protein n=1 Tax=Colwellia marinimaniae TaxID=1513592 RepID=A0ABQ0MWV5_9GAMM|nr:MULTISPECIES: DUF523 domain-containing protein [Colwellia]ALO33529.1 hypothetical protein CMT41_01430 [Colwellia sp. MT41]GAW96840.1 hypothetical protein MTCD1_02463 [Colwellia marinimaniae]